MAAAKEEPYIYVYDEVFFSNSVIIFTCFFQIPYLLQHQLLQFPIFFLWSNACISITLCDFATVLMKLIVSNSIMIVFQFASLNVYFVVIYWHMLRSHGFPWLLAHKLCAQFNWFFFLVQKFLSCQFAGFDMSKTLFNVSIIKLGMSSSRYIMICWYFVINVLVYNHFWSTSQF